MTRDIISWLDTGKTAVITGGANGIGLAAAERYLGSGMNVVIADNNETALADAEAALSSQLSTESQQLMARVCDVSDAEQVMMLRDQVTAELGTVHCLMNNAGASVTRAVPWDDLEGWKNQLDVNLWGIIHGCQAFVPGMLDAGEPVAVINTGSKQGITNPPTGYAYNMSKAAVLSYTQSLAHALRETENCPISVHLLVPGFTYSNMIARFISEKPAGAWTTGQVIDYMLAAIRQGDFAIICPDNDTPRELDERRMQWHMDDLILNRPALSRWHPDYARECEAFTTDI